MMFYLDVFSFLPPLLLRAIHWTAGIIILAEALNKLERTDLFDSRTGLLMRLWGLAWLLTPWWWKRHQVIKSIKLIAWVFLATGAASAVATPFMQLEPPTLQDASVLLGFALLIVRTRFKEFLPEGKS